jgi:hypothetical protein
MSKTVEADLSKGVAIRNPRDGEYFRSNLDLEKSETAVTSPAAET